jgi:tRNA threonylcarbamoyladenosine biosynthesis protein TsaE
MPTVGTLQLDDEIATCAVGAALAKLLLPGDAIAMVGDLGAGKTTLVSSAVATLGVTTASSPTYALVHEYAGRTFPIWHIDLYRLERASELPALGLDDSIGNRRGVSFVEWADKFAVMPASYLELQLHHGDTGRRLTIIGHGAGRGLQLATALWRDAATLPGVSL